MKTANIKAFIDIAYREGSGEPSRGNAVFLIQNPVNLRYFIDEGFDCGTLIFTKNRVCFLTDFRYIESAKNHFANTEVEVIQQVSLAEDISKIISEISDAELFIESNFQTINRANFFKKIAKNVNFSDFLSDIITSLRVIKRKIELNHIKSAQKISEKVFGEVLKIITPGMRENELAAKVEILLLEYGAKSGISTQKSFPVIALSGKNTSLPHGTPSQKSIERGDFVTLDFGCKVNDYCSDMTRTVAVGAPCERMVKVYDIVLAAQQKALAAVKSGTTANTVDSAAREHITAEGYGEYFGHATGHGVGLEVHESPRLSAADNTVLKTGMVVTIEPGIYIPRAFGVRIEDMVVVTKDGCENLTKTPKKLLII